MGYSVARARQEKSLLDLIKPNAAIVTGKSQRGALGAARTFTRSQKPHLSGQSRTRQHPLTSASGVERWAKPSAAGPANPIPGSHLSEAGRLLKSYKTSSKPKKIRMAQSLLQSRQPQYSDGANVRLGLKEGATPQDKHLLRAQILNQQSYLRSEQEQQRHEKQQKNDAAT